MFFVTFLSCISNMMALMSCFSWKSRSKSSSCRIPLLCMQHLFFPCQFSISTDKVMFFKIGLSLQHLCPWCVACKNKMYFLSKILFFTCQQTILNLLIFWILRIWVDGMSTFTVIPCDDSILLIRGRTVLPAHTTVFETKMWQRQNLIR